MMRRLRILCLTFLIIGCTTTVAPHIYLGDKAICELPCWYGIVPGRTSADESVNILHTMAFIESDSVKRVNVGGSTDVSWRFTANAFGHVIFEDDKLIKMSIAPTGLLLGNVIDQIGTPDSISAGYEPAEIVGYSLTLYYPHKGIVVRVLDRVKGGLTEPQRITQDLNVSEIQLFVPTTIEGFLTTVAGQPKNNVDHLMGRLQPWPGYGDDVVRVTSP